LKIEHSILVARGQRELELMIAARQGGGPSSSFSERKNNFESRAPANPYFCRMRKRKIAAQDGQGSQICAVRSGKEKERGIILKIKEAKRGVWGTQRFDLPRERGGFVDQHLDRDEKKVSEVIRGKKKNHASQERRKRITMPHGEKPNHLFLGT